MPKWYKSSYRQIVRAASVLPNRPRELGALFDRYDRVAGMGQWQSDEW